jgi:hypothetical protein
MRALIRNVRRKIQLASSYAVCAWKAPRYRDVFRQVKAFTLFIGYPRSGHSLVGSLIDAHSDAIIAHEANALKALRYGFRRDQIFYYLLRNSERFTQAGRLSTGYSYLVPGQWQGRFRELRVIGDKYGDFTTTALVRRPWLLERLREEVKVPVKFFHVLRSPYDNITTIFRRSRRTPRTLPESIEYYFSLVEGVARLKERIPAEDLIEVQLEEIVASPVEILRRSCEFLGLVPGEDYLQACASIVFKSPKKTHSEIEWPRELVDLVRAQARAFPFLAGLCEEF